MTLFQKSLLATGLLVLALAQLSTITLARGWIAGFSVKTRRRSRAAHHLGGYIGLVLILFLAYYCKFVVDPIGNPYKRLHVLLGVLAIVLVVGKVAVARLAPGWRRRLPFIGLALLAAVIGAWASSALWYLVEF